MTKNKTGTGKFFLGAALGAMAGTIIGKLWPKDCDESSDSMNAEPETTTDKCNCEGKDGAKAKTK